MQGIETKLVANLTGSGGVTDAPHVTRMVIRLTARWMAGRRSSSPEEPWRVHFRCSSAASPGAAASPSNRSEGPGDSVGEATSSKKGKPTDIRGHSLRPGGDRSGAEEVVEAGLVP